MLGVFTRCASGLVSTRRLFVFGYGESNSIFNQILSSLEPTSKMPRLTHTLSYTHAHTRTHVSLCLSLSPSFHLSLSQTHPHSLTHTPTHAYLQVTYRGHNYPVWDVCFSALGHVLNCWKAIQICLKVLSTLEPSSKTQFGTKLRQAF